MVITVCWISVRALFGIEVLDVSRNFGKELVNKILNTQKTTTA